MLDPTSPLPVRECPEPLRGAFLELLTTTLLWVRAYADDSRLCFALADQMHNVPSLLADFRPEKLRHYWEVERPCFLRALEAIDRPAPRPFAAPWGVIEAEYRRRVR